MPAAVIMSDGGHDGSRPEPEGGLKIATNGLNGSAADGSRSAPDKATAPPTAGAVAVAGTQQIAKQSQGPPRMNDLPDEIKHITQGFVPLSRLLTRLAQSSHNKLQERIIHLAGLPLPSGATNGNAASSAAAADDVSSENLQKKAVLLTFAQDLHAKFVKALVITEWSRKADMVSKLIDLNVHINEQKTFTDTAVDTMINNRRMLTFARLPSPDLKTALHVLSTGTAPWFPDFNYLELPPMSAEDKLTWVNDLNTLLSLRLNLDEFDKIPPQFRNYEIASGRVTFKVAGEFEVDLTIADEDFEKQFWFIDFRLAFKPAVAVLSDSLRQNVEWHINAALLREGLAGAYHFLHEFTLTAKINEIKRQAWQLSKGAWAGTLVVEQLHRALAIQYWTSRAASAGLKSWVLIAVNSGRKKDAPPDQKPASYLTAKWYRENKEVEGAEVTLDVENLSAEAILRNVIGMHIEFVLRGIYDKLLNAPRFRNKQAGMLLQISKTDPAASALTTQVGFSSDVTLSMEPMTGVFAIRPHSKITFQFEHHLNNCRDMVAGGVNNVEHVRCALFEEKLSRQGSSNGWHTVRPPLTAEEVRIMTKKRDWSRNIWIKRDGWGPAWFVAVLLSLGGDEWWLVEKDAGNLNYVQPLQTRLPLNKGSPQLSDDFWQSLAIFTTGMIAQSIDSRELYSRRIKNQAVADNSQPAGKFVRLPVLEIELSNLFPSLVLAPITQESAMGGVSPSTALLSQSQPAATRSLGRRHPWAKNIVRIAFKGLHAPARRAAENREGGAQNGGGRLVCISVATVKVQNKSKLAHLSGAIDRDVTYKRETGEFKIRIRHEVGESTLPGLKSRLMAIDRFVSFLEALDQANGAIVRGSTTLRKVTCYYGQGPSQQSEHKEEEEATPAKRGWELVLDLSGDEIRVHLEKDNPSLRLVDLLQKLVNLDGGIKALLTWLPLSLPAMSAIDKIDTEWQKDDVHGAVDFSFRALDWIGIHYKLRGGDARLSLEFSTKSRKDGLWWHLRRPSPHDSAAGDSFTQALKPIWEGKGQHWQGLITGAAGRADGGVANLLEKVDEAIRALASGNPGGQPSTS